MKKMMEDFISKLMLNILKNQLNFIIIYHFHLEEKKIGIVEKLVTNFHDKCEYASHIGNLNQGLNHGLIFKKVHRVIKYSQNAWLK